MTQMRPIWVRHVVHRWDWCEWDAWTWVWTDMTETRNPPLTLIWVYHMTETPRPDFAQIWLRRPKKFCFCILILHTWDCARIKIKDENFVRASQSYLYFGSRCLSHISVNGGFRVSLISVQTLFQASHSYQSQRWTTCLTHIGLYWIVLAHSY